VSIGKSDLGRQGAGVDGRPLTSRAKPFLQSGGANELSTEATALQAAELLVERGGGQQQEKIAPILKRIIIYCQLTNTVLYVY